MPHLLENCILCRVASRQFQLHAVVRGWRYVRCADCRFVFLNPQPTEAELGYFYDHFYHYDPHRYQSSISRQQGWLELLEKLCEQRGDLLEIGCSYGYFLQAAMNRGWKVQGMELGGDAADFARNQLGLPVQKGRIADLRNSGTRFDVIVAWHVLEHDPLPRTFVETAFDLLRPGGILALRVPNLKSAVARLAGPCWQWLSPPEHVCMYTEETLSRLLADTRFEIVAKRSVRGNARNMWFEIARARIKESMLKAGNGQKITPKETRFDPPPVYQDRLWYRATEGLFTTLTWPLDQVISPWMAKRCSDAELALFARKPGVGDKNEPIRELDSEGRAA